MAMMLCRLQQEGSLGFGFKFSILASGYAFDSIGLSTSPSSICSLPSLHIFGGRGEASEGADRQVSSSESEKLLGLFDSSTRRVLRHGQGHVIPCTKQVVSIFHSFLNDQLLVTSNTPS